ncbi:nucleotidyltransferase family protein [Geodermatophilus sp. TF02-6]|uniref:nucleotidyltransferase family protein n=1 Tax=Geodermatophilus sp. TF02-6 TaxID=2250575 RepID=UPI0018F7ABC4|nr:nucleotidyltransferase family protein [Geodermatophilus sp. TF02-6]
MRDVDCSPSPDTSRDAEDAVIRRGGQLFADLPVPGEIRDQARVHLWHADGFGTTTRPLRNCADAIEGLVAVCCCCGVTVDAHGRPHGHAPHGYDDLFSLVTRPNRHGPAPRYVFEAKAAHWTSLWPELTVLPWEGSAAGL